MITPHTIRLFPGRLRCDDPDVIVSGENKHGAPTYSEKVIKGKFYHVSPQCAKEVFALQMMEHGVEKFAPAGAKDRGRSQSDRKPNNSGNGVIVSAEALARFDAQMAV